MFNRRFGCAHSFTYTKLTYATPGTYTYSLPGGVTKIRITVAGGGGSGGATITGDCGNIHYGGSGGVGGRIAPKIVSGSGTITIVVGAKGGGNGGNSSVTADGTTYTATGGRRGGNGWCSYHYYTKGGGRYEHGNGSVGAPGTPTGTGGTSGNGYVYIEFGGDIL